MVAHNHNYLSRIPVEWLKTAGYGVKIGVCDSGCDIKSNDLSRVIKEYKEFSPVNVKHGTHVVGIISSSADNCYSHRGYCARASLYVAGLTLGGANAINKLVDALTWLSCFELDVLNLSFAYAKESVELKELLYNISRRTLIVAAYSAGLSYPHCYDFVISVGVGENSDVDIIAPGKLVSNAKNNNYVEMSGTSMATAYITSVVGLARAYDKEIGKDGFLINVCGDKLLETQRERCLFAQKEEQITIRL